MSYWITLKIGESRGGHVKTLHAMRSTANYYGWTDYFEEWVGETFVGPGGKTILFDPGRRGHPQCSGGRRIRISRSPNKHRYAAGFTNAFKVSHGTGLFDLAELAHFTKVDWHWMESLDGERVNRARWEDRYLQKTK